jgi:hypothetical protein
MTSSSKHVETLVVDLLVHWERISIKQQQENLLVPRAQSQNLIIILLYTIGNYSVSWVIDKLSQDKTVRCSDSLDENATKCYVIGFLGTKECRHI